MSDGTLPEHLRQPGETQLIEEGKVPFLDGQSYVNYYAWGTYTVTGKNFAYASPGEKGTWGTPSTIGLQIPGIVANAYFEPSSSTLKTTSTLQDGSTYEQESVVYPTRDEQQSGTTSKFIYYNDDGIKTSRNSYGKDFTIGGFVRVDGKLDTGGNPPPQGESTSASTTNNNAPTPKRATVDNPPPPGIRPPLPSDRTASPTPSRGFKKPSRNYSGKLEEPPVVSKANNNPPPSIFEEDDERPRVELPAAINTPAPEPPPSKEYTSPDNPDAGKTFKFGELPTADAEEEDLTIISERIAIRGDGTKVIIKTREATPEELRDINRTTEKAKEVVEEDRKFRFGDNYDGGIDTDINLGSPPEKNKNEVEEEERTSPGKINKKVTPVPPETDDDTVKPPAEPDDPDAPPFVPPPPVRQNDTTECKGCNKKILDKLGGFNTALQGADLLLVQQIHSTVHHPEHGLAKIQGFAKTAWKAAQGDKIMSGVTMALTIHNAMMLSNNLASTISEAVNMSFNALGIRNEEDKEIDIGEAIRTKISEVLSSALGAENYTALTARIAKANRIYQASINLLDTTYSLFDSARTVAELTAEHTGKIGNALRESGAVYEDAYDEFLEKVNPQNTSQRKLERFREGLESVENVFDTVSQISSSVVETKENIQQIKEEKNNLIEEVNTEIETKKDEKDTAKIENQVTTDISENDFDRGTASS